MDKQRTFITEVYNFWRVMWEVRNQSSSSWTQIVWILRGLNKEEIWHFSEDKCAKVSETSV